MASFDKSTPFMLLARIHVKPGCVDQYLELARVTDEAVQASEPGMIHHTFDQDPEDPQAFLWSEVSPTMRRSVPMFPTLQFRSICKSMRTLEMGSALRSTARLVMNADS